MKKVILIVILCIILLLSLAAVFVLRSSVLPSTLPVQTEPPTYNVSFQIQDTCISQQTVTENALPQAMHETIPGATIVGWTDAQGLAVDPFTVPVLTDTVYQAVFYPVLSNHVPFLFADEAGLLQPDAPLTQKALSQALNALAAEGATAYFPALSEEDVSVTYADLTALLHNFFEDTSVAAAFRDTQDPTRSAFAAGMLTLLGRDTAETLTLAENAAIPTDVTATREDAAILLEASVEHTTDDAGITWGQLELPTGYEPGFVNVDGQLYYVQEDRYFLRDGYVGTLYFDADGRYTSGDATLDATVVAILQELMAQNPDADRFTLLRAVYDHCHQNYTYRRTFDHPEYGSTGWEIQRANAMFETTKGNCYSYAAIFWALSRGLGYETRAISGKVLDDEQPHSWCIIELEDGNDYFFDPQWQYNYTERGIFHYDMFQIPMDKISFWLYQWEE